MPDAVQIDRLSKWFENTVAVENLSFRIGEGEMFGIVGPDGAGKTTTLRMLCGILSPTSGDAKILGHDLRTERRKLRRYVGYLAQRFSLYGDLTVDENIEFYAEIHEVYDYHERREELLAFTRLTPFRSRLADQLSGGMKQKLALACTLVPKPRIIFLDEPTTGVDPVSRRDFWKILSDLLESGITIVMTTPYLDEAERCSRVALMNAGRVMVCDTPQRIKSMMEGSVIEVVCDSIRKAAALLVDSGEVLGVQSFGDRLNIVVDEAEHRPMRIRGLIEKGGIQIQGWRTIPPSLENVFISLMSSGAVK